ncbi:MAG: hypothetical protein Q7T28_13085 [Cypionkella sp.]|nr:hypothetical protein [Cypionkella sp.]
MKRPAYLCLLGSALFLSACVSSAPEVQRSANTAGAGNLSGSVISTSNGPETPPVKARNEKHMSIYLTGYSYWDNTPPGSAAIAKPVLRNKAGGTGTYDDPITIAVGHMIVGDQQFLDFPAGTRFYLSELRKYAIVEDVCGDGASPQNGPCHTGHNGLPWLDIYVDGARSKQSDAATCMSRITRVQPIIQNPAPDYPTVAGSLTESGCQVFRG